MDLWEILGLLGLLTLWAALGCIPWFVALVMTQTQRAPWRALPIVMIVGVAGALLAPALGLKGWAGFWTSFASALLLSSAAMLLLTARSAPARRTADA